MTEEGIEKNLIAMDDDAFQEVAIFIMENNPDWMTDYQEFQDKVALEFIPFIQQNQWASKAHYFFKDMERDVEGTKLVGFTYTALLTMTEPGKEEVIKGYELFFPVGKDDKPYDVMMLQQASERTH